MTFTTPVDGQPALAEHVAQLTENLNGTRTTPISIAGVTAHQNSLLFSPDNAYDIGASGATRPRDLFLGRDLYLGGAIYGRSISSAAASTWTLSGTSKHAIISNDNTNLIFQYWGTTHSRSGTTRYVRRVGYLARVKHGTLDAVRQDRQPGRQPDVCHR